jgi:succinate-acetate transporter protein
MLNQPRNGAYIDTVAYVFCAYLAGVFMAASFNNLPLIPALQSIRQPIIGLFLSLWIAALLILRKRMSRTQRSTTFMLFILISLFTSFFLLAVSGGFVKNCEVTELRSKTEIIYKCELNGSGSGTFRAQIDSPVMKLISSY